MALNGFEKKAMLLPHNDNLALFARFYIFPGFLLHWGHIRSVISNAFLHKYTFLVQVHLTGWHQDQQRFGGDFVFGE